MSYETRYAAAKQARSDAYASSPEAAEARLRLREALRLAKEDAYKKYTPITKDNSGEFADYYNERVDYWRRKMSA